MRDPRVDRLVREIEGLRVAVRGLSSSPRLVHAAIEDGTIHEFDRDGNLVGTIGKQHDGTHGAVKLDGPVPPTPSTPVVTGGPASITVEWDGRYADVEARAPLDFHVVEAYAAPEPFTSLAEATLVAAFPDESGGTATFARPVGTWHVALVAKSQPGRRSPLSALASAEATTVLDPAELERLESDLGHLQAELESLEETTLPALRDRLAELEDTTLPALRDRLQEAEDALGPLPADIQAAKDAADAAQAEADAAHDRAVALEGAVGTLQGDLAEAETALGTLRDITLPGLTTRLGDVEYDTRNFAAEWITAGTLDVARLNAESVAGAVGTFISLRADQITALGAGFQEAIIENLVARTATLIELDAEAITSGTIDTERLNASEIGAAVGAFVEVRADQVTAVGGGFRDLIVENMRNRMFVTEKLHATEANLGSFIADDGFVADLRAGVITVGSIPPSALVTPPSAGGNAIPDPHFQSTALTDLRRAARGTSWNFVETTDGRYLHRLALGGQVFYYAPELTPEHAIPVAPGSGWQFSIPVSGRATTTLGIEWVAADGTTHTQDLATVSGAAEQQWIQGEWAAPADAVAAAPFVRFASAAQTVRVHGGGRMESYSLSEQVVDMWRNGRTTIDGGHIETGTIKAHHLDAESLETDTALIGHLVAGIAEADLFVGREFLGGTFTGATFRTTGDRLRLDDDGLTGRNLDGSEYLAINDDSGGTVTLRVQPGNLPDGDRLFPAGTLQFEHVPGAARAGIGWTDEVLPRFIVGRPGSGSEPSINLAAGLLVDWDSAAVRGGGAYGGFVNLGGESVAGNVIVSAGSAHQPNLLLTNTETVLWGELVRIYGGSTRFEHDVEIMGDLLTPGLPWRMAAGKVAGPTSSERTAGPVRVYFPTGRFTQPPIVTVTSDNGLNASMATTVTTTYFEIHTHRIYGQAVYSHNVYWTAVQMSPTSAGD